MRLRERLAVLFVLLLAGSAHGFDLARFRSGVVRVLIVAPAPDRPGAFLIGGGSGFIINDAGTIVTNNHVVDAVVKNKGELRILYDHTARELAPELDQAYSDDPTFKQKVFQHLFERLPRAEVMWTDAKRDMALLKPHGASEGQALRLGVAELTNEIDPVWVVGYPASGDAESPSSYVTLKTKSGHVVSKERSARHDVGVYQVDAVIQGGNSGGPLMNACGDVIGINTETFSLDHEGMREAAYYSLQVDSLVAELDALKVAYTRAGERCEPSAVSVAARDPVLLAGVLGALLLGVAAVAIAANKRGREVVREAVSRRLYGPPPSPPQSARRDGRAAEPSHAVLRGVSGEFAGMELELDGEELALGRDPRACQLVFLDHADLISKRHCTLRHDAERQVVVLEDCWSTNGTFLADGDEVKPGESRALQDGDRFYVGDRRVLFEVGIEKR